MNATKTPGYNRRLEIFFQYDVNGRNVAYRWCREGVRALRVGLADAENWIAQGQADLLACHPIKGV